MVLGVLGVLGFFRGFRGFRGWGSKLLGGFKGCCCVTFSELRLGLGGLGSKQRLGGLCMRRYDFGLRALEGWE